MPGKMTVLKQEWIPQQDAMKRLGKSERSVQRLAAAGEIRWKVEDGTRQRLYHAGDVERVIEEGILAGRQEPQQRKALAATSSLSLAKLPLAPAPIALTQKLWLSLDEASELSNLGKAYLLRAVVDKRLLAVKAPGWRIQRASLESFTG